MNGGRVNRQLVYDCMKSITCKPLHSLQIVLNIFSHVLSPAMYTGKKRKISTLLNRLQKARYRYKNPGHPTATEVKNDYFEEWKRYWTFSFVRNPFEKAVSDYLWRKRLIGTEQVSFREFMERVDDPTRDDPEGIVPLPRTNWPIYTINDSPAVDFVGRHEQFREHLECAFSEIGVPFEEEKLPKTKQSISYDYRSFYDNQALEIVERVYKKEIDYFSYSFN